MPAYNYSIPQYSVNQLGDEVFQTLNKRLIAQYNGQSTDGYIVTNSYVSFFFFVALTSEEATALDNMVSSYVFNPNYENSKLLFDFSNIYSTGNTTLNTVTAKTICSNSLTATTISGGTIYSGGTNIGSLFGSASAVATLQSQILTKTNRSGDTFTGQVNASALSATTLSAGTISSYDPNTGDRKFYLRPITGHVVIKNSGNVLGSLTVASEFDEPTIVAKAFSSQTTNIQEWVDSAGTKLAFVSYNGGINSSYLSGGTIYSGGTNIGSLFGSASAVATLQSQILTKTNRSGDTFTGQVNAPALSATTISGGTIYSGGTNLYNIFATIGSGGGGNTTYVQPGSNITTGGTALVPIISVAPSPSFNNINFSGTAVGNALNATTISGGTIYSGNTELSQIFKKRKNYVLVQSFSDLPTPVNGIIYLSANTVYDINGQIQFGNTMMIGDSLVLRGMDKSDDGLVYTGTGYAFSAVNASFSIDKIYLSNPIGNSRVFNILNDSNRNIQIQDVIFTNCKSLGTICGSNIIIFNNNFFQSGTDGIAISGNTKHSYFDTNIFTEFFSGSSIQFAPGTYEDIRITNNHFQTDVNNTAINISTGITLTQAGEIFNNSFYSGITGTGNFILGVSNNTYAWEIFNNDGLETKKGFAQIGFVDNAASMTLTTTNQIINGTYLLKAGATKFDMPQNGRIRYTGKNPISVTISCNISGFIASSRVVEVALFKNGNIINDSRTRFSMYTTPEFCLVHAQEDNVKNGDYFEVMIKRITNPNTTAIVEFLSFLIERM